jgi:PAS domain S-box-containing protein
MKFFATFRQALVLNFIAVALLPILLLGYFGFQYFTNKHFETVSSILDTHAVNVSKEATEFMHDTSSVLYMLAGMIEDDILHGKEIINRHLQVALEHSGSFESIFVLNKNHKVIHLAFATANANNLDDYLGLDMSSHDIFANNPVLTGSTWSDTFLSAMNAEPSVTLGIPLKNGTLLGTVSLERLTAALRSSLGIASRGFNFSLLDHDGVAIADSRPEVTAQRLNMRLHPEVANALDNKVEVSSKYHEDRSLLESVRLVPETGWVAYVSLPTAEIRKEVRPLQFLLLAVLSLTFFLGAILSYWLSRHTLKPVVGFADAAANVARGNYEQTLPAARYEELENLSKSFGEMIRAIEDRENSLKSSQDRFRGLVNSIDGIVWELNIKESRFTFVSEHSENILGYPAHLWLEEKKFWENHIHEDDRDRVISFCEIETEAKRDYDLEYRMIAADGRVVWLKDVVSVVVEGGQAVRLSGVMLDITTRKEAERVTLETAERMTLLIERMPFGFILYDAEHKVKLWNPAAEKIFGYQQDEIMGCDTYDFIIPDDVIKDVRRVHKKLDAGDLFAHSINENSTKDGRRITCEWHNTPLMNVDGSSAGIISMVDDITVRIQAENALKESEARLRTVFETNPDAVLISRASDGKIISVNDYCSKLSGYSRDEMLGKTTLELGLWVNNDQRNYYLDTIREQGMIENFEIPLRIKGGRERIGLASARTLVLNDELCLLNVIRDITEMKDAERRMIRSESRFRSLVSVMGEGILILAFDGEIVQCNQAAERILKHTADEMIGKLHNELDHDAIREDGTPFSAEDHPAAYTLRTGKPVTNQVMGLPQEKGSHIWVQVNAHALGLGKEGQPLAVVASFADVTELIQVENELRENEKRLQALSLQFQGVLEAFPDRILILDKNMKVIWLNWPEESIPPDIDLESQEVKCYQLPGVNCGPTANQGSPLCDNCPVKKTFNTGRSEIVQKELKDGRTLSLRTFPVCDELGEVINVIEVAQDITDSLKEQNQAMRNAQLASLGELAAGVAHEINNPINGVINYAQLILNKALADSREKELSERIIRESERIATIVRELLYFSREESLEIAHVSVDDVLQEVLSLTQHQMNKEAVHLEIDIPASLPLIESRSHQIQRLFLNLIGNARYALREKFPKPDANKILRISAEQIVIDDKPFVQVVFRDHGTGIPASLLDKVMNPFVTTKPSAEGTGLGLSISHEIVQKHGGTINIFSAEGEYTEVVVELPALK